MAFFINSDLHKKNLSILAEQPNASNIELKTYISNCLLIWSWIFVVCESFLKLAREYIIDGRNEQQYATIAGKTYLLCYILP